MSPNNNCAYANNMFTTKAIEVLHQRAQENLRREAEGEEKQPFFLYLAYTIPHAGGWKGAEESGSPVPSDGMYNNTDWPNVEKDHASAITNYEVPLFPHPPPSKTR